MTLISPINNPEPTDPTVQWRDVVALRHDLNGLAKMINSLANRIMVLEAHYDRLLQEKDTE